MPAGDSFRVCARSASAPGKKTEVALEIDGKYRTWLERWATEEARDWTVDAMRETIRVESGQHILRLKAQSDGFRLDWLELVPATAECAPTG